MKIVALAPNRAGVIFVKKTCYFKNKHYNIK